MTTLAADGGAAAGRRGRGERRRGAAGGAGGARGACPGAAPRGGTFARGPAAVRQGRRCLGCEKMASHFAAGVERMASCDMDALSPVRVEAPQWGDLFAEVRR